jgi:hypothetical protein
MVLTRAIIARCESPSAPGETRVARVDGIGDVSLLTSTPDACPPQHRAHDALRPRAERHHRRPQRPEHRGRPRVDSSSTLPDQQFELSIRSKGSRRRSRREWNQKITYDTTMFVSDSIREVVKTPFEVFGLVVIVVSSAICAPPS